MNGWVECKNNQLFQAKYRLMCKLLPLRCMMLVPPGAKVLNRLPHISTLNVADNRLTDRYGHKVQRISCGFPLPCRFRVRLWADNGAACRTYISYGQRENVHFLSRQVVVQALFVGRWDAWTKELGPLEQQGTV